MLTMENLRLMPPSRVRATLTLSLGKATRHSRTRARKLSANAWRRQVSQLFSPFDLGGLPLKNRVVIAPMCQYSTEHSNAGGWHRIHLGHQVLSDAGLMILEATAVEPQGRIRPADLGL